MYHIPLLYEWRDTHTECVVCAWAKSDTNKKKMRSEKHVKLHKAQTNFAYSREKKAEPTIEWPWPCPFVMLIRCSASPLSLLTLIYLIWCKMYEYFNKIHFATVVCVTHKFINGNRRFRVEHTKRWWVGTFLRFFSSFFSRFGFCQTYEAFLLLCVWVVEFSESESNMRWAKGKNLYLANCH